MLVLPFCHLHRVMRRRAAANRFDVGHSQDTTVPSVRYEARADVQKVKIGSAGEAEFKQVDVGTFDDNSIYEETPGVCEANEQYC